MAGQDASEQPPRVPRDERDELARAALSPLGEREWPPALRVAIAVCLVLAAGVIAGAASIHDLSRHGGSLPGAALLAVVFVLLAQGMYRRRYWAVLSFEALLAFQILVTSLALVVAETLLAAGLCTLSVLLSGWLFWKLVRVMGRVQVADRAERHLAGLDRAECHVAGPEREQAGASTDEGLR